MPSQQTEQEIATELVRRIRNGERNAEGEMVERYSRGLLLMLNSRTQNRELAKDLRQDTFCVAIERLRSSELDKPGQLSAYLSGIARNLAIGDVRKNIRRKTSSDTDFLQYCADDSPSVFQALSRGEVARLVRMLLGELPVKRDREILTRLYVYDQDRKDICDDLALDSLHFNRVLSRAKSRFRKLVEESEKRGLRLIE